VATDYAFIKKLIWAYFLLLLFEGALRKWFLPGLSQGLLIIRDPIVIWIYYLCYAQGRFSINNKYLQKCFQWVGLAVVLSFLLTGHIPYHCLWSPNKPASFPSYFHHGPGAYLEGCD
jgi:hypothetical protein